MHALPVTVTVELNPRIPYSPAWAEQNFHALFHSLAHSLSQRPDLYVREDSPTQTSLTMWVGIPEASHIEDLAASRKLPALEQEITELKRQLKEITFAHQTMRAEVRRLNFMFGEYP